MTELLYIVVLTVLIQISQSVANSSSDIGKSLSKSEQKENHIGGDHRRIFQYLTKKNLRSGLDNPRISSSWYNSNGQKNHDQLSEINEGKRGGFVSQQPKYLLEDSSSYQEAIRSLQQMLKGIQSGSFSKQNNGVEGSPTMNSRYKRYGRNVRNGKGYLDYTNSQMPFNEGTKRKSKGNVDNVKGKESKWNYSRVRRFLEEERMMKGMKGCNTLEAKEAAMSRVLDPNLNLDGILEPHVRKRRRRSLKEDTV